MDPFSSEKETIKTYKQEDIEAAERRGLYGDGDMREYAKIDDSKPKLARQRKRIKSLWLVLKNQLRKKLSSQKTIILKIESIYSNKNKASSAHPYLLTSSST